MSQDALVPIHVRVMLNDLQRDISRAEGMVAGLESAIGAVNATVRLNVADGDIRAAQALVNDLNSNVSFTVNVTDSELDTAAALHNDLETNTTFTASVTDSAIDTAVEQHDDLNTNTTFTASVDDAEIEALLQNIQGLEAIQVGITLAGGAMDIASGLPGFALEVSGISDLIEIDRVLGEIEGRTGQMIPGAQELIEGLWTRGWGQSRQELGQLLITATQLGVDSSGLETAMQAALQVVTVTGGDANETLRTMQQLVSLGLVSNITQAGDVMVAAFQNGGDRAGDLNDTLIEYASTFATLGLDAQTALAVVTSGMEAGFMNTDLAADALREFNTRVGELDDETVTAALDRLNLTEMRDAFLAGSVSGETFLSAVLTEIEALPDASERAQTAIALFGTQAEDVGTEAILALNPARAEIENIQGAANDAASAIRDNLGDRFNAFMRTVRSSVMTRVDELFDISGLLDRLETAIEVFFDNLDAGDGIIEAAEDAFELPGLADTLQMIQQVFANIGIGLLDVFRTIGNLPGIGFDTSGIDDLISTLGTAQLGADLYAADDMQAISESVRRAVQRGVDPETIAADLAAAFDAAIAAGDVQAAQAIADYAADVQMAVTDANSPTAIVIRGTGTTLDPFASGGNIGLDPEDTLALGALMAESAVAGFAGVNIAAQIRAQFRAAVEEADLATAGDLLPAITDMLDAGGLDVGTTARLQSLISEYETLVARAAAVGMDAEASVTAAAAEVAVEGEASAAGVAALEAEVDAAAAGAEEGIVGMTEGTGFALEGLDADMVATGRLRLRKWKRWPWLLRSSTSGRRRLLAIQQRLSQVWLRLSRRTLHA
ncbi:hypothetical protein HC928_03800 [bacterium]|nr:hypothetical protein [bacterium]